MEKGRLGEAEEEGLFDGVAADFVEAACMWGHILARLDNSSSSNAGSLFAEDIIGQEELL